MNALNGRSGGWKPTAKDKGRVWLGFAACFFLLAAHAYAVPSSSPFLGRWGWLYQAFFDAFGASGEIVLNCIVGCIALAVGITYLTKEEA